MGTEIKTWQIIDGKLHPITASMADAGNRECDLESWIAEDARILGRDIAIIGRQTHTKAGPLDLLGMDREGNTVIVELKRDKLAREVLAQAIDYASDVAEWDVEKLEEICLAHRKMSLEEVLAESFPKINMEALTLNATQRILMVGLSIESRLERMIQWMSDSFSMSINAVVLSYAKTAGGDEILIRTAIVSEEVAQERISASKRKYKMAMSDDPGTHELDQIKGLLIEYLSRQAITNQRIRNVLLPALQECQVLTREELRKKLLQHEPDLNESKVGYHLSVLSIQLGMLKNDFLRQVIAYEYPNYEWEKDNFSLRPGINGIETDKLVEDVLAEIDSNESQ